MMITRKLAHAIGKDKVFDSKEVLVAYSFDASRRFANPSCVVFPEDAEDIAKIIKICAEEGIPITPRGAGSGLVGGAVPEEKGVVVSSERLRKLKVEDGKAIAQAGVITAELTREVQRKGFFFPPQPSSYKFSTIGGNIAADSAGLRCVKYGSTGDYVLALEIVTPEGEIVKLEDNLKLVVGSEGTLCFIVSAELMLISTPKARNTICMEFKSVKEFIPEILSKFEPSALEILDPSASKLAGISEAITIIMEVDGEDENEVNEKVNLAEKIAKNLHGKRISIDNPLDKRTKIGPALAKIKPFKFNEDVVFPISRVENCLKISKDISSKFGLPCISFGHAGVGIIHMNILWNEKEKELAEKARIELFRTVIEIRGSITGEHGVGLSKKDFLKDELGETHKVLTKLKKQWDPANIMNPSKLLTQP